MRHLVKRYPPNLQKLKNSGVENLEKLGRIFSDPQKIQSKNVKLAWRVLNLCRWLELYGLEFDANS